MTNGREILYEQMYEHSRSFYSENKSFGLKEFHCRNVIGLLANRSVEIVLVRRINVRGCDNSSKVLFREIVQHCGEYKSHINTNILQSKN